MTSRPSVPAGPADRARAVRGSGPGRGSRPDRGSRPGRVFGAAALVALAALAAGCGIRPTAVPVDAGAPASRTACPTAPQIPTVPAAPSPVGPTPPAAHSSAKYFGSPSPSVTRVTPGPSTPPADNVFTAVATPSPTASATCR
ncbi:hypothetical protein [Kitasatospora sp. NPDC005751]|uniref:hypothetical protein n=1 Tax=unclassified Kitasatospora TaxID=2633591 RepID=UPI0033D3A45B